MINPRITNKGKLGKVLDKCWQDMHLDKPKFVVITGRVRTGKSRSLFLNIIDYWYKTNFNKVPPKDCFGVKFEDYINSLNRSKEYNVVGLDEGGDTFNKSATGRKRLNDLYETYGIIMEKRIFTIIVLPSIFDLDNKFAQNHVTYWINATRRIDNKCKKCDTSFVGKRCYKCGSKNYKEGYVIFNFYTQNRLRKILQYNENRPIKKIYCGVKCLFQSMIKEYKGELIEYYSKLKSNKIESKIKTLNDNYGIKNNKKQVAKGAI